MDIELVTFCQNFITFFQERCLANASDYHVVFTKDEIEKLCLELEIILNKEDIEL